MKQNRLLALIKSNLSKPREFKIEQSTGEAEIHIYDVIDSFWGFDANEAAKQVHAMNVDKITVYINSPGGDVFEAVALQTVLRNHKATVAIQIDGLAASAATSITLAGDTVKISEGGFFMIHRAWSMAFGNADELTQAADLLTKIDQRIAAEYAQRTGKTAAEMLQAMAATTWYNAEEAKAVGFVNEIIPSVTTASNHYDLSAYDHVPDALLHQKPANLHPMRAQLERRLTLWGK